MPTLRRAVWIVWLPVALAACGQGTDSADDPATTEDAALFTGDTIPRLLQPATVDDGLSAEELGGAVEGPWWALSSDPAALHRVTVQTDSGPHPCVPDDPGFLSHSVTVLTGAADASGGVIALLRGLPLRDGPVAAAVPDSVFMAPESPAGGADSASYMFANRPVALWRTPHGEGFRVHVRWAGAEQVVYSTDTHDEGSWEPVFIGDVNRDSVPDLLIHASNKYSLRVLRLIMSDATQSRLIFREVATAHRAAC